MCPCTKSQTTCGNSWSGATRLSQGAIPQFSSQRFNFGKFFDCFCVCLVGTFLHPGPSDHGHCAWLRPHYQCHWCCEYWCYGDRTSAVDFCSCFCFFLVWFSFAMNSNCVVSGGRTAMLCYVTPKEHLGLPNREDVKALWETCSWKLVLWLMAWFEWPWVHINYILLAGLICRDKGKKSFRAKLSVSIWFAKRPVSLHTVLLLMLLIWYGTYYSTYQDIQLENWAWSQPIVLSRPIKVLQYYVPIDLKLSGRSMFPNMFPGFGS